MHNRKSSPCGGRCNVIKLRGESTQNSRNEQKNTDQILLLGFGFLSFIENEIRVFLFIP